MLTFDKGKSRFSYRAVAVIIYKGKVLLHKTPKDKSWALPGGRVEFFEPSSETVAREMKEELDIEVSIKRPLWFVENFFSHLDKDYHEISTFFLLDIEKNSYVFQQETFFGKESSNGLIFQWANLGDLSTIELYPSFLRYRLSDLPENLEFLVHRD